MSAAALSIAPARPSADAGAADPAGEFSFDARDFDRVRALIYARAGISLMGHWAVTPLRLAVIVTVVAVVTGLVWI